MWTSFIQYMDIIVNGFMLGSFPFHMCTEEIHLPTKKRLYGLTEEDC